MDTNAANAAQQQPASAASAQPGAAQGTTAGAANTSATPAVAVPTPIATATSVPASTAAAANATRTAAAAAAAAQTAAPTGQLPPETFALLQSLLSKTQGQPQGTVDAERLFQTLMASLPPAVRGIIRTPNELMQQLHATLRQHADKPNAAAAGATPTSSTSTQPASTTTTTTTTAATGAAAGTAGAAASPATPGATTPATPTSTLSTTAALTAAKAAAASASTTTHPAYRGENIVGSWTNPADGYPAISQNLSVTNPGPVSWAATRPTLTGGLASGRMAGTPAQIKNAEEAASLAMDEGNRGSSVGRRKNTNSPGEQGMRRTIQDLVASVDPNVKIEPEVEDLLLSVADEFIDSVTNFACRLTKHRGGDTLEVRDLQLHLERNHNIRIPGFASDETRMSLANSSLALTLPPPTGKKNPQSTHMSLRNQRLAQVQQAKREAKLM